MSKSVVVTLKDNGTFSVVGEEGVANFGDKDLVRALEEVVYQIRKKRPLLGIISADVNASVPEQVKPTAPVSKTEQEMSHDKISEEYYNGGLGPRIDSIKSSGMGFGVG